MRNNPLKNKFPTIIAMLLISVFSIASPFCSHGIKPGGKFVCIEHGIHNPENKEQFCECFSIKHENIDDYLIFSNEAISATKDITDTAARCKNAVADEIVNIIVLKLETAFGNNLAANWRLEQIDLPVLFRTFASNGESSRKVKVIAIIEKKRTGDSLAHSASTARIQNEHHYAR